MNYRIPFVALAMLAACKHDAASPVGKAGCPAGSWREPGGAFCANLHSYQPDAAVDRTAERTIYRFRAEGVPESVVITWKNAEDVGQFDAFVAEAEHVAREGKLDDQGELSDHKGRFVLWHRDRDHYYAGEFFIKGHKHVFECDVAASDLVPPAPIELCKSVTPTD